MEKEGAKAGKRRTIIIVNKKKMQCNVECNAKRGVDNSVKELLSLSVLL